MVYLRVRNVQFILDSLPHRTTTNRLRLRTQILQTPPHRSRCSTLRRARTMSTKDAKELGKGLTVQLSGIDGLKPPHEPQKESVWHRPRVIYSPYTDYQEVGRSLLSSAICAEIGPKHGHSRLGGTQEIIRLGRDLDAQVDLDAPRESRVTGSRSQELLRTAMARRFLSAASSNDALALSFRGGEATGRCA